MDKMLKKDYHGNYEVKCYSFSAGTRCSYCSSQKIHMKDSFGEYHKEYWECKIICATWLKKSPLWQ